MITLITSRPIANCQTKKNENFPKIVLDLFTEIQRFYRFSPLTCLRKYSEFFGLVTTRNKGLGIRSAIKATRSSHVECIVMMSKK